MKKLCAGVYVLALVFTMLLIYPEISYGQDSDYDGKPLSEWVSNLDFKKPAAIRATAQKEIRQIGTNALPFLLKEMDDLGKIWNEGVTSFNQTPGAQARNENLHTAFLTLGSVAKPAVPALVDRLLINGTNYEAEAAAFALVQIDPQVAAIPLNQALTNSFALTRMYASDELYKCGTNADIAVTNLIQCLKDHSSDKDISHALRESALKTLIMIYHENKQEQILAVFIEELKDDDDFVNRYRAAGAIGILGKEAPQAVIPILTEMSTNDPDKHVRSAATNALKRIQ